MIVQNITLSNISCKPRQSSEFIKRTTLPTSCADIFVKTSAQSPSPVSFRGSAEKEILTGLKTIIADELSSSSSLIQEVRVGFLEKIAKKLSANEIKPLIIGIAGEPAAGKSTVTETILKCIQKLSKNKDDLATVIHCDNYYEDLSKQLKIHKNYAKILESGYDPHNPKSQNLDLVKQHLNALKEGKKVVIPDYKFDSCESIPDSTLKNPAKIIMYEGIFALAPKIKDLCDIKIYIDAPQKLIEQRSIERAFSRGNDENATRKLLFGLEDSTQKYIRSAKKDADLIVRGNSPKEAVPELLNKLFSMFNR